MTKYFSFNGVATRSEYWVMILIVAAIGIIVGSTESVALMILVGIPLVWFQWSTYVRRIRETGNNPWWVLLFLLPVVNVIALIVFGVMKPAETKE